MERDDTPLPRRLSAANDSDPPSVDETKGNAALTRIARLIGRQIARETVEAKTAANDNNPPGSTP
jgi:hypothetical protein